MAVTYLAVIYRDGKEINRWLAVPTVPQAEFWLRGDILMMKTANFTFWSIWTNPEFWTHLMEKDVPKTIRLLALLE